MILLLFIGFFGAFAASQDPSPGLLSDALSECYNETSAVAQYNKLPHNIHSLIAMIRKIEENPMLQKDLRQFSVALLHRFRQDGIERVPNTISMPGVIPYSFTGITKHKWLLIMKMIPGEINNFPNQSLSLIERCSLHSMISTSFDMNERGDEATTCQKQRTDQYRFKRNLREHRDGILKHVKNDVETLTPEELLTMKNNNKDQEDVDPNSFYPVLPPNHPENAQMRSEKISECPLTSGVISTEWGNTAGGSVLAGIAAGLQHQNVKISDLVRKDRRELSKLLSERVSNKWMATLAGDLAEVAVLQIPYKSEDFLIGVEGHWNSSFIPKHHFMEDNDNLYFTAAEIRGGLDGLILGSEIESWYRQIPSLRLSQILDMYYSDRGVFNASIRACNRRTLLTTVAPNETASTQAWRATETLYPWFAASTIDEETRKRFAVIATNKLMNFIPSQMNNDKVCKDVKTMNHLTADLTIFVDTNWPWSFIQQILTILLENSEINKFASNFTLINAHDGRVMINNSNSILDFYNFNETHYLSYTRGFDPAKIMTDIQSMEKRKLSKEWETQTGGARSSISLIIPYISASISDEDKEYCLEVIRKMREDIPDTKILFLTAAPRDKWSDLTEDPLNDVISSGRTINEAQGPIINLINRMKQVPRRLINSQCGANWSASGQSSSYINYVEPFGINFYRLHPNYFYTTDDDNVPAVKISGSNGVKLTICSSRNPLHINTTTGQSSCTSITSETHRITISCADANFIHKCNPLYLSIVANSSDYSINQCTDPERCRYPDMTKYTISYENLRCANGAGLCILSPIFLISIMCIYIQF